jgi:ketosteroid isomerase-like protein
VGGSRTQSRRLPTDCAAIFTDDIEAFSPYAPPARGRAAIEALHSEWVKIGGEDKELRVVEAGVSGDLGA